MEYEIPDGYTDKTTFISWDDGLRSVHDSKILHKINGQRSEKSIIDEVDRHFYEIKKLQEKIRNLMITKKNNKVMENILVKSLTRTRALDRLPSGGIMSSIFKPPIFHHTALFLDCS